MSNRLIDLQHITKIYDDNTVLDDLNLYIRENEFLTLLGPSGCGKTTTLRIIGGFEKPDNGCVLFNGKDITNMPPNKRQLNTVFQKYALFPHMTIAENIAFGLKIKGKTKSYIQDKIRYALKLVNLDGYENRMPDSLSGGQQQRIAIARAIVNEPKLLLLDEPLGALDLKLRQDMQYELIRLKNELGITFIYVTHDQEEALTMSDTIVVMNQGYIQQIGTPEKIYNEPENAFLERFPGEQYVDMVGIDIYEFDNDDAAYQQNLSVSLDVMMAAAKKVGKIPALTETGCRGISQKKDWFTKTLWPVLQKYQVSYVLFWRNAWDKPQEEAYLPGVGDGAIVNDFKAFKNEKKVLFVKDIKKVK